MSLSCKYSSFSMGDWKIAKFEKLAPFFTFSAVGNNGDRQPEPWHMWWGWEPLFIQVAILVLRKMDYTHNQKLTDCIMQCKHSWLLIISLLSNCNKVQIKLIATFVYKNSLISSSLRHRIIAIPVSLCLSYLQKITVRILPQCSC